MVGGVVSSIRGDTPETKRKVVAYRIHNWDGNDGVREALIRQGVMVRGTSNSTYKFVDNIVDNPKKFRPKVSNQVRTLKDLKAQPTEYKTEDKTPDAVNEKLTHFPFAKTTSLNQQKYGRYSFGPNTPESLRARLGRKAKEKLS